MPGEGASDRESAARFTTGRVEAVLAARGAVGREDESRPPPAAHRGKRQRRQRLDHSARSGRRIQRGSRVVRRSGRDVVKRHVPRARRVGLLEGARKRNRKETRSSRAARKGCDEPGAHETRVLEKKRTYREVDVDRSHLCSVRESDAGLAQEKPPRADARGGGKRANRVRGLTRGDQKQRGSTVSGHRPGVRRYGGRRPGSHVRKLSPALRGGGPGRAGQPGARVRFPRDDSCTPEMEPARRCLQGDRGRPRSEGPVRAPPAVARGGAGGPRPRSTGRPGFRAASEGA